MDQRNRLPSRIAVAVLVAMMTVVTAYAAVPAAPTNLAAEVIDNRGFASVRLTWTKGDQTADGFNVYMSPDAGATWQPVDRVADSSGSGAAGYVTVNDLANGTYDFRVAAFNADGESAMSNTATAVIDVIGIRFDADNWSADSATVGVEVRRDFDAESSDGAGLVYRLSGEQIGMTIDPSTGVFTWTPSRPGHYMVEVVAALPRNPAVKATLQYIIVVEYGTSNLCATISGTVSDASGLPVAYGDVSAMILADGGVSTLTGRIEKGRFSIAVPEGTMIVHVGGSTIVGEYYNDASAQDQAERIVLDCGQQRELAMTVELLPPPARGLIQGTLVDTAGNRLSGPVIAYRIDSTGGLGDGTETQARSGFYGFYDLAPGEYVVWGNAIDSAHVPGYHVANDVAALSWTNATRVTLDDDDSVAGLEIRLVYLPGQGGTALLRGTVVTEGGRIRKHDDAPGLLGATPVAGATVYVIDGDDDVFGYDVTDASGGYSIEGLTAGSYTVLVDKVGYKPLYAPTAAADDVETTLELTMESATSAVPDAPRVATGLAVYPNPINASARIRFDAGAGTTLLTLTDVRGNAVISRIVATVDGENSVRLETETLPAGVYLLRLGNGASSAAMMINVAH